MKHFIRILLGVIMLTAVSPAWCISVDRIEKPLSSRTSSLVKSRPTVKIKQHAISTEKSGTTIHMINLSKKNIAIKADFPGIAWFYGLADPFCPVNPRTVLSPFQSQTVMDQSHCAMKGLYLNETGKPKDKDDFPVIIWGRGGVNLDQAEYTIALFQRPDKEWDVIVEQGDLQPDTLTRWLYQTGQISLDMQNTLAQQAQEIIREIHKEDLERAAMAYATGGASLEAEALLGTHDEE